MRTTSPPSALAVDLGQVARRVGLELLEEHALGVDLAQDLPVGGAGDADADRHAGAVARQADDAHVVAEILAAELRADAHGAGELQHLGLEAAVAEGLAAAVALGRQVVEIARAGELDGLEGVFRRGAADDDGEVIGRAGGGAQRADLLVEELDQRFRIEHRLGLLVEEALVGGAAALGDEQELVLVAFLGIELDLRRQVVAGVDLLVHRERRHLAVAQIGLDIGLADAGGDRRRVAAAGPDALALLAHDDRRAGVLAHRQHPAGGDVGVLEQVEGDELVVVRGLGVVEDAAQLLQMAGPQQVLAIGHGLRREQRQRRADRP